MEAGPVAAAERLPRVEHRKAQALVEVGLQLPGLQGACVGEGFLDAGRQWG